MIDLKFYNKKPDISLSNLAKSLTSVVCGKTDISFDNIMLRSISSIDSANPGDLVFISNEKYLNQLSDCKATACIAKEDFSNINPNIYYLTSPNPYYSYAMAIDLFYGPYEYQLSDKLIDDSAKIGKNVKIGRNSVISYGAEIGDNSVIGHGCFIGHGVRIGKNARIDHNVTIEYSIIGDDVVILSGARIGNDGFGFASLSGKHRKIFHIGRVIVGNDVEIGANSTIDRGSLKDTLIKDGVRIDNLVQIAHNVEIGTGSVIVAQVGIAGSSKLGNYCVLGGQVGVAGHLSIADRVQIAGQGGVIQNIEESGSVLGGTPTLPIKDWHRQSVILKKIIKKKGL